MYEIVKSEMFCGNQCDFYESDNNEILMTAFQLGSCLGYSDPNRNINKLISRNEYLKNMEFSVVVKLTTTDGKQYNTRLFTEDGIYEITMLSKTDKARQFRAFVREVIKSIRKHGAYMTPQTLTQALSTPENLIALLQTLQSEQNKNKELSAEIEVMKPKASYYDLVLNCKDLVPISVIAKDYGKSATWLNRYLREKKIQYRQGNIWLLYQKYSDKGYASTKTNLVTDTGGVPHVRELLCWSQKGRLFIYKMLKNDGILPLMEHEATA